MEYYPIIFTGSAYTQGKKIQSCPAAGRNLEDYFRLVAATPLSHSHHCTPSVCTCWCPSQQCGWGCLTTCLFATDPARIMAEGQGPCAHVATIPGPLCAPLHLILPPVQALFLSLLHRLGDQGSDDFNYFSKLSNTEWESQDLNPGCQNVRIPVLASLLSTCVTPLL